MLPSDEDLVRQIALAQPGALASLYDRYSRLVYSLALRICGNPGLAEEITQDVFMQVWTNAASYQPDRSKLTTWLTSITRYRAIDQLRRLKVRPDGHVALDPIEEMTLSGESDAVPEVQVEHRAEQQRVTRALAELPEDQRAVLMLAYFNGMSQPEMADYLGEPLGTIKTRVRLGLRKLHRSLAAAERVDE
jgi:RNA polymerase sigma-70 factor (ECF subfamily)